MKVLVAYGTKKGSTQEVAERIAEILCQQGVEVDLLPASEVKDLGSYAAAVLGGSIYIGRLHPDVMRLLKAHQSELAQMPFAIFAMGPQKMEQKAVASARQQLDINLRKVRGLRPESVAIFGGVIDPAAFRFPFNRMPASDARDWDAIRDWALSLPAALSLTTALREVGLAGVGH